MEDEAWRIFRLSGFVRRTTLAFEWIGGLKRTLETFHGAHSDEALRSVIPQLVPEKQERLRRILELEAELYSLLPQAVGMLNDARARVSEEVAAYYRDRHPK